MLSAPESLIFGEMLQALSAPAYRTTLGAVRGFASRIAELPPAQRADAIASAERYFPAVLHQFGYTDDDCNRWTSIIMRTLRPMVLQYFVQELRERVDARTAALRRTSF